MTNSDLNKDTNVPHRLKLGDVLGAIELSPGEISTFLGGMANQFLGGAHHNMGLTLRDHAAMVANPETYGYKVADQAVTPGVEAYVPPSSPAYAESFGGKRDDAPRTEAGTFQTGPQTIAERTAGTSTTRPSIPAHPTDLNPFAPTSPPASADLSPDSNAEPAWMADARRAGWNPNTGDKRPLSADDERSRDEDQATARGYAARATPAGATPGIYHAPDGPPVDPKYQAPYTDSPL